MTVTPKSSLSEYQWEAAKATGSPDDASGDPTVVGQLKSLGTGATATGSTTDAAGDPTVVGQLKAIEASTGALDTTTGAAADASGASTVIGQLKAVNTVTGAAADAAGDSTVIGQLKAIAAGVASDAVPSTTLTSSQVTVAATATSLLASNTARVGALIVNNGTVSVFLGQTSGVTTSNGLELPAKAALSIDSPLYTGALYGIVASGTAAVTIAEFS